MARPHHRRIVRRFADAGLVRVATAAGEVVGFGAGLLRTVNSRLLQERERGGLTAQEG